MAKDQNRVVQLINAEIIAHEAKERYETLLESGKLTKTENPMAHLCGMIIVQDPQTKKILVVHHKKADSWIFPGGHIETGESPIQTIIREANEELGLTLTQKEIFGPFSAQVLDIYNPKQTCREHYDIFYGAYASASAVTVDMREFHDYKWLKKDEANIAITLPYYKNALEKFLSYTTHSLK